MENAPGRPAEFVAFGAGNGEIRGGQNPAQSPLQFTRASRPPNNDEEDIGDKLDGYLWRVGCDEWRLVNNAAVPGTKHWIQTRGAKTIYTDNQVRAANSVRNLQAGNSWDDFCDLEFTRNGYFKPLVPITTKLRRYESARKVGMQASGFLPVQMFHFSAARANDNSFRVVQSNTTILSMSAKSWGFIDRNESPAEKNAPTKTPRFVKCRRRK